MKASARHILEKALGIAPSAGPVEATLWTPRILRPAGCSLLFNQFRSEGAKSVGSEGRTEGDGNVGRGTKEGRKVSGTVRRGRWREGSDEARKTGGKERCRDQWKPFAGRGQAKSATGVVDFGADDAKMPQGLSRKCHRGGGSWG